MSKGDRYQPLIDDKGKTRLVLSDYDPTAIPPNKEIAQNHFLATQIGAPVPNGAKGVDPATGLPIDNKPLSVCCGEEDMNFLSPGYPMFFQFVKFCMVVLAAMMLTGGIHNAYTFYYGESCTDRDDQYITTSSKDSKVCTYNFANLFSIANRLNDRHEIEMADVYSFFTITTLLLVLQIIRKIQKTTALTSDERQITASDYTARVQQIPQTFKETEDIDEEIKRYFETSAIPGVQLNVQQVSVCYNCDELCNLEKKIADLKIKKAKLSAQNATHPDIPKLETQIRDSENNLSTLEQQLAQGQKAAKYFEGEAYVTFETQAELQKVLKHWKIGGFKRFIEWFKSKSIYKFRGKLLKVKQASEPSDINWQNAGTSHFVRFILKLFTNLVCVALLALSFAAIYETNHTKVSLLYDLKKKKFENEGSKFKLTMQIQAVSTAASFIVVFVNTILKAIIGFLAKNEKHTTQTDYMSSFSIKLCLTQLVNTAVVTFVVYLIFGNLTGPGGLNYTIFIIFCTNALVEWGFAIFSTTFIFNRLKKWSVARQKQPLMTQKQLNDVYRYPEFDFAGKYAIYAKTVLAAAFFAPLIPIVLPVAFVHLFLQYWFDKFMLLKYRSRGPALGPELAFNYVEILEYSLVLFSIGNFLANFYVIDIDYKSQILTIIGFGIGIFNAILPMNSINEFLFPTPEEKLTDDTYSKRKYYFLEDYDRSNPATRDTANSTFRRHRTVDNF